MVRSRQAVQADVRRRREQWLPYYRRRQQDVARLRPRLTWTWTAEVGRVHQEAVRDVQTDLGGVAERAGGPATADAGSAAAPLASRADAEAPTLEPSARVARPTAGVLFPGG